MRIIKGMGALSPLKDVRNYVAVCSASKEDFPEEYILPGKLPPVEDQKDVNDCVGYAQKFVADYFDINQGDNRGPMSASYLYGNRSNGYTGYGRHIVVANRDFLKFGVCARDKFPEHVEVPKVIELCKERMYDLHPEAYPNRISSFYEIHDGNNGIRATLMSGSPVLFSMEWYDDIEVDSDGVMQTNCVPSGSYHAMVIYGWNKDGWKIQNSWGTDWGKEGRAILPYNIPRQENWGYTDTHSENLKRKQELEYIDKIIQLTNALEEKQEELDIISDRYHEALALISSQREKIGELESKISNAETAKRDLDLQCESLENQIKQLRVDLATEKETSGENIAALQEMIAIRQSELATFEANREEYVDVIRTLNAELAEYKANQEDIRLLEDRYAELMKEYDNCINELSSVRAEKAELENQIIQIKKPYSSGIGQLVAKVLNFILNLFAKKE